MKKSVLVVIVSLFTINSFGINIDRTLILEAKNHLKFHEGFRSKPYICPGGKPTIGYGHQLRKGEHIRKISLRQADNLLERDIRVRFIKIKKKYKLNDRKTMALTLFSFNLGIGTLYKSTMSKTNFSKNLYKNWTVYCKVKGKVHKALKKRRDFEYKLFKSGEQQLVPVIIFKSKDVKNVSPSYFAGTITSIKKFKKFRATKYLQS